MAASRYSTIVALFGEDALHKIRTSKVLVVGAGGIGCELLKDMVLSGFENIEVIDLDTIDVSNLNRQFLFRSEHVGKSKAEVARQAALEFNPRARIVAHHDDIKKEKFGIAYFKGFALVLNALDNIPARRHVNRLCLAAGIPLIEAGTTGELGQAYVIKKGETACYECEPLPVPKKFPICTIRSTPEKPVHCVVWAKELYRLLLGDSTNSSLYEPDTIGGEAAAGGAAAAGKSAAQQDKESEEGDSDDDEPRGESVYMRTVKSAPSQAEAEASPAAVAAWTESVFDAIFRKEIEKRLSMSKAYKNAKHCPKPLVLSDILKGEQGAAAGAGAGGSGSSGSRAHLLKDQAVLSLAESAQLFLSSLQQYYTSPELRGDLGKMEFSKDSAVDLNFITAATNLRAFTFSIPMQSRFDVKSIAGNIVPAIATTNAIAAGLEVLEAIKILKGDSVAEKGRLTYILSAPSSNNCRLLSGALAKPNAQCYVCGKTAATLFIDTQQTTLRALIDQVLKGQLAFNLPNIDNGTGFNFLEEREEDEEDDEYEQKMSFLTLPLAKLVGGGIKDGSTIEVTDFSQDMTVRIHIVHKDKADFNEKEHPNFFQLVGEAQAAKTAAKLEQEKQQQEKEREEKRQGAAGSAAGAGSEAAAAAAGSMLSGKKRGRGEELQVSASGAGTSADAVELLEDHEDEEQQQQSGGAAGQKKSRQDGTAAAAAGATSSTSSASSSSSSASSSAKDEVILLDD